MDLKNTFTINFKTSFLQCFEIEIVVLIFRLIKIKQERKSNEILHTEVNGWKTLQLSGLSTVGPAPSLDSRDRHPLYF